ncbi:MAG: M16 family metallopeptidase [bacterium]|jgi:zinc protease
MKYPLLILTLVSILAPVYSLTLNRDSLPNGIIILTCEDHRLPMVDIALVCRSGAAAEPVSKAGIADLCARMLFAGTKNRSADSIATLLDFLGASYSSSADFDHSIISLRLLSKDLNTGIELLADLVLNPAFPQPEFDRLRTEALTAARRALDYPQQAVAIEFDRLLFGSHRYALPVRGDTTTLTSITIEDLRHFHQTFFVPNNCFLVVVGDFDPATLKPEISARFGNWQPGPVPMPALPQPADPGKIKIKLITRKDMNQTYIQFGHSGISATEPDLIPVRLMSYILGGPPLSSRMGLAVREQAGLAYDVRCWFDRRLLTGAFRATVQTASPKAAIQKMFAEIIKMHSNGATRAELLKAQNYFTGSFPLTYSNNSGKLQQLINLELYRYGIDWLDRFPQTVRSTTLEQVNQAARQRLKPGNYLMVIMGNVTRDELNLPDVEWIE